MNERIQEIARQATNVVEGWSDENGTTRYYEFNREKFAELIVAECVEVCRRGKYGRKDDLETIQFDSGIRFCMHAIDDHFGD